MAKGETDTGNSNNANGQTIIPTHTGLYRIPEVHVEMGYSDPVDIHDYDDVIYNETEDAKKKDVNVENFTEIDLDKEESESVVYANTGNNRPKSDPEGNVVFVNEDGNFSQPTRSAYLLSDKVIEDQIDEEKASAIYATKKTIAQGMLDIALLTANTSQLRVVLQSDEHSSMRKTLITFISFSIALQVLVGLCLLYIGTLDKENSQKKKRANIFNNVVTMLIFMITIINVMVSSFGLENMHQSPSRSAISAPPQQTQPPQPPH